MLTHPGRQAVRLQCLTGEQHRIKLQPMAQLISSLRRGL
ncbi:hypothetical protein MYBA111488_24855 [Mycobacterium basiliense]